jgi:hypothetical protein
MKKDRIDSQSDPNRASNMEPAEGSRETVRGSGSSSERGRGSSGERDSESSSRMKRGSEDSGGITNRELSREEAEQEQLPERGRSESER